jgi:hypothetical protein
MHVTKLWFSFFFTLELFCHQLYIKFLLVLHLQTNDDYSTQPKVFIVIKNSNCNKNKKNMEYIGYLLILEQQ